MTKQKTDTYLAITRKGEQYIKQLAVVGYTNLPTHQRIEWNVLNDLASHPDMAVTMSAFLAEGRDTILGRTFSALSERAHGQLAIEGYGKTLHSLITQGYVRAFKRIQEETRIW